MVGLVALGVGNNGIVCWRCMWDVPIFNVLRFVVFCLAICGLWPFKKPYFVERFAAFRHAVVKSLAYSHIRNGAHLNVYPLPRDCSRCSWQCVFVIAIPT